jgi:hypothetical protein
MPLGNCMAVCLSVSSMSGVSPPHNIHGNGHGLLHASQRASLLLIKLEHVNHQPFRPNAQYRPR